MCEIAFCEIGMCEIAMCEIAMYKIAIYEITFCEIAMCQIGFPRSTSSEISVTGLPNDEYHLYFANDHNQVVFYELRPN